MQVNRLHPLFAAELVGADLAPKPDGMLVIRGQDHVGDDAHIRFSEAFRPLELSPGFGGLLSTPSVIRGWSQRILRPQDKSRPIEVADHRRQQRAHKEQEDYATSRHFM